MASIVVAVSHHAGDAERLGSLAWRSESGADWSVGDRHVVEVRLDLIVSESERAEKVDELTCDVGCRDDGHRTPWGTRAYDLFSATGPWDEEGGLRALEAISKRIRRALPNAEFLRAGIEIPSASLVLAPDDVGWEITERFEN